MARGDPACSANRFLLFQAARRQDVVLGTGAHVRCLGKGRKQRCTPLRPETVKMLDAWVRERHGMPGDPVFPSMRDGRLSRDAIERRITKYTHLASQTCASLRGKKVSPHVCRHAAAMDLLQHGVDRSVIALWLGHESPETTQMYLHADMRLKEKALSRTEPLGIKPARYRPDDRLLAFLESLRARKLRQDSELTIGRRQNVLPLPGIPVTLLP